MGGRHSFSSSRRQHPGSSPSEVVGASSKVLDLVEKKMVRARKLREDSEKEITHLEDIIMQLDEGGCREGLELLHRLREILQEGGVMDEVECACEVVGLDEKQIQIVLDCIGDHLREGVRGSAFEVLREVIGRCHGSGDCGLCYSVLERVEAKDFHKERTNKRKTPGAI